MEVEVDQWNDAKNEAEEVGLQRSSVTSYKDIEGGGLELDQSIVKQETIDVITTKVNRERILQNEDNIEESIILPASDSPIPEDPTSLNIVTTEIGTIGIVKENDQERQELYLEREFEKTPTHGFYCPNCNSCIQKVYIQHGEWEQTSPLPLKPIETIRCSSCFSFLIPIGSWLFPGLVSDDDGALNQQGQPEAPDESTLLLPSRDPAVIQEEASSKALEILKSIVYGGLTESLASLSVVTSAASANATTLNIVALAMANLIGGLFIFVHNLGELKAEQPKRAENQTEALVDRYNQLLGQKNNFFLHAFIAIISFIVFGLVPPVVYGFSFLESGDKDSKLAALACASLLCIILLSTAKAYIQRPNSFVVYFKTVLYYVSTGALASVLSYLAGDLVRKLLEKVPWFELSSNFCMQVPRMRVQKN